MDLGELAAELDTMERRRMAEVPVVDIFVLVLVLLTRVDFSAIKNILSTYIFLNNPTSSFPTSSDGRGKCGVSRFYPATLRKYG